MPISDEFIPESDSVISVAPAVKADAATDCTPYTSVPTNIMFVPKVKTDVASP